MRSIVAINVYNIITFTNFFFILGIKNAFMEIGMSLPKLS